jgi:acetyl-CoA carboxylase biotin carboxylase subunit
MLAKLIVHAPTRALAIARMRRALHELTIDGIETSRGFHLRVMNDAEFQSGDITIQWLEQRLSTLTAPTTDQETLRLAAIAAALVAHEERTAGRGAGGGSGGGVSAGAGSAVPVSEAPRGGSALTWAAVARREGLRHS